MTTGRRYFLVLSLSVLGLVAVFVFFWKRKHDAALRPPFAPAVCFPEPTVTSNPSLEGTFATHKQIEQLPQNVVPAFRERNGARWAIVNPGRSFQVTDNISDVNLPWRRLIFWGQSGDITFVHYEQGGSGLGFVVAAFRSGTKHMQPVWRRYCPHPARDFDDLKDMIRSGECPTEAEWHKNLSCKDYSEE